MDGFENLRVLVLRENWLGNTGLSAFTAMVRAGTWASSISEQDYVPLEWRGLPMRLVGHLLRPLAVKEFNDSLLRAVDSLRPHLFLAVKGTFVKGDTLRRIRKLGTISYCFYPDVSMTSHGRYLAGSLPEYDWIFTTKSFGRNDLERLFGQRNCSFLPHAYDPMVHQPRQPTADLMLELGCDVSFIGTWSAKKQRLLEALVQRRPKLRLKVWGNSWQRLPRASPLRAYTTFKPIIGIGYASAISCSKINLALLSERVKGAASGDLITSRTFHIPACGGLMLHERTKELLRFFKEDESCVCFEGIEELVEKIDQLLSDVERRSLIAARSRDVVRASHSWDHRVRAILEHFVTRHGTKGNGAS